MLKIKKNGIRRLFLMTLLACFSILSILSARPGSAVSASIIRAKAPICAWGCG